MAALVHALTIALAGTEFGATLAELDLEEGSLVALALGDDLEAHPPSQLVEAWPADERALLETFTMRRRRTWVGGRLALRRALGHAERAGSPGLSAFATSSAILCDDRGAPSLPPGVVGSIAHKDPIAVAIAAPLGPRAARGSSHRVGVDVELAIRPLSLRLASRILCPDEAAQLLTGTDDERSRALLMAFSAKEAIYKAIDPFVRRYVGFHEVKLRGDPSRYDVEPLLASGEGLDVEARAFVAGEVVIAVARACRR